MAFAFIRKSRLLKLFFFLAFLPFILFNDTFHITELFHRLTRKRRSDKLPKYHLSVWRIFKKVIAAWFLIPLCVMWIGGYAGLILVIGLLLGVMPLPRQVVGKSMFPTLRDEETVFTYPLSTPLRSRVINRGDMILFSDKDTIKDGQQVEFIKRVVGIPNDKIEIKNGYLLVNEKQAIESYVNTPRSTFGNTFLQDCREVVVPKDAYFVLGDNRKRSQDSRMVGFVSKSSISSLLPISGQNKYKSRWTNTDRSNNDTSSFLNPEEYVSLLNKKRQENNVKPLAYEPKLSKSAESRGKFILKYSDFSFEATKSGYTMAKAMSDANYYNVVYGEYPLLGYYNAQELIDFELENSKGKEFLLNKDYQDIGVSTFVGDLDRCPVQIIVQHLAGYVPPNYTQADIDSWKKSLDNLISIIPSWEKIKDYSLTYNQHKQDADRLLEILHLRISRIQQIINKMGKVQWLTSEEINWIKEEQALFNEEETIAKRLNSFQWQH